MSEDVMPSITVRPFAAGDEEFLVEIWFTSWMSVGLDRPIITQDYLASRLPNDLAQRWDTTVAEADGKMLGFLAVVLSERRLDQLFVAPGAQGQGIGHRLFEIARQKMPNGFWLSTQPENIRARSFYERAGMQLERVEPDPSGDKVIYKLTEPG